MPEPNIFVLIRSISFNQDEDEREASVEFEFVEEEDPDEIDEVPPDGYLSIEEKVPCSPISDDFIQIVHDAAKSLHSRLLKAAAVLAKQHGL